MPGFRCRAFEPFRQENNYETAHHATTKVEFDDSRQLESRTAYSLETTSDAPTTQRKNFPATILMIAPWRQNDDRPLAPSKFNKFVVLSKDLRLSVGNT